MSIAAELEKLTSLKNSGELSQAEYERAKSLLLAGGQPEATTVQHCAIEDAEQEQKEGRTQLLGAVLATLAAILSGITVLLDPSGLKIGMLIFWTGSSLYGWQSYATTTDRRSKKPSDLEENNVLQKLPVRAVD